jgi:hypothetical protein
MCCSLSVGLLRIGDSVAVAYLVKGQHLSNELPAVFHGSAHLVVDLRLL